VCAQEISSGIGKIKKVGVLGGTFDPIHNGHLAIAEEVREAIGLLEVIFIPAGQPWMKANKQITPANHRLEMTRLAIEGKPYFKLSALETDNPDPTYTVDTLEILKGEFGGRALLYFIMSWETLEELPRWKEPDRLIQLCRLVVTPRAGFPHPDMTVLQDKIPGLAERAILLEKPVLDISATDIRKKLAKGLPVSGMVPEKVERYIKENGLYRK
jgi:nicotinate-nucleotide adenylyltransferase